MAVVLIKICSSRYCHQHHQEQAGVGYKTPEQNIHVSKLYHHHTGVVPKHMYFLFQCRLYEKVQQAAMGSPVSSIMANLYMEDLKPRPLEHQRTPQDYGKDM